MKSYLKKTILSIGVIGLLSGCSAIRQSYNDKSQFKIISDSAVVAANVQYDKAGKLNRVLLGDHYRKEWKTPVHVRVLDIDKEAGGLTPLKEGGGFQTKSLRLKGADGKEYVLRSINKDPTKAIPLELSNTMADDIVQDQISSSNPYAPLAVAELADAAGILHTNPEVVFVPEHECLDVFNADFGNSLCLFDLRPAGDQHDNDQMGNSFDVVNSEKMFRKVLTDNNHRMDDKALLNARLFDMWIGDWDRHEDQWLWASFKEGSQTIYKPVPRDRDQAFVKLDGFIPQVAARKWAIRKTQDFNYTIRDINGLNGNGIFLDKEFLAGLSLNEWLETADTFQKNMTDEVIEAALKKMPPEIYAISGEEIVAKLKMRRDDLKKYAVTYYEFLSKEVDIVGTEKKEFFEVERKENSTHITVSRIENSESKIILSREFSNYETSEIRLYGLGGNDIFKIKGSADKGILIRVVGGNGNDNIADESSVSGWSNKTKIYDTPGNTIVVGEEAKQYLSTDTLSTSYNRKGFQYDWVAPLIAPGFNPDDGFYFGGGAIIKQQQFGKLPFGNMQSIWANHSFTTGAYNFSYKGVFRSAIGKWDYLASADVNAPNNVLNFFGYGNETKLSGEEDDYNRVRADQFIITQGIRRNFKRNQSIAIAAQYQTIEVENNEGRFLSENYSADDYLFSRKHFAQVQVSYNFNTTDNELYPTKGINFNNTVGYSQDLEAHDKNYVYLQSDVSVYKTISSFTFLGRVGGATNFSDDYEFYQANSLGGTTNLRGFRKSRFSGETSLYENTEVRWKIDNVNCYVFKADVGLLAFSDVGRVWVPGENSDCWHNGYGGGFWFMPFNKMAFTVTYSMSKEEQMVNLKGGFLF